MSVHDAPQAAQVGAHCLQNHPRRRHRLDGPLHRHEVLLTALHVIRRRNVSTGGLAALGSSTDHVPSPTPPWTTRTVPAAMAASGSQSNASCTASNVHWTLLAGRRRTISPKSPSAYGNGMGKRVAKTRLHGGGGVGGVNKHG